MRSACVWLLLLLTSIGLPVASAQEPPPVIIDYFYTPGCSDCATVEEEVLPELRDRYEHFYQLRKHNIMEKRNILLLSAYQKKLGVTEDESVSMYVDYHVALNGVAAIRDRLFPALDRAVEARMAPDWTPPEPITASDGSSVVSRFEDFTGPVVAMNGLLDGLNPCAIGTLVFFMSLLAVTKVKGKRLLMMGISFCLASFVTYTGIGFGLLHAIHALSYFGKLRASIEMGLMGILVILAVISFRDAAQYARTQSAGAVAIQLPHGLKLKIHDIMRHGVRTSNLMLGGLVIGIIVTVLESVCTGQVYVPTMVLVIKTQGELTGRAWQYLLLYNTMFILPLAVVFVLTYTGLQTQALIDWSKRHVVVSKVMLGVFFVGMAVLIAVM